jgi:hypothetical protein
MTRLSVFAGVAVLALVAPGPTAPSASDAAAPRLPLDVREGTRELTPNGRSPSARPANERRFPARDPNVARVTPRVSSYPDDRAHRARLDEALERFERAGLLLPDLDVEFSDDGCYGHLGLFDPNSIPWRVTVCSDLAFVLTHELAHAWAAANLDDAERAGYLAHRGLSSWNDPDLHWRERGTEDAAFVLQQVLMSKHLQPQSVWAERIEAYEQLTGGPPTPVATEARSDRHAAMQRVAVPGRTI